MSIISIISGEITVNGCTHSRTHLRTGGRTSRK